MKKTGGFKKMKYYLIINNNYNEYEEIEIDFEDDIEEIIDNLNLKYANYRLYESMENYEFFNLRYEKN